MIAETAEWRIGGEGKNRRSVVLLPLKSNTSEWPSTQPRRPKSSFAFFDAFLRLRGEQDSGSVTFQRDPSRRKEMGRPGGLHPKNL